MYNIFNVCVLVYYCTSEIEICVKNCQDMVSLVMAVGTKRVGNNYVKEITNLFFYLVCAITCKKKKIKVKVKVTLVQALRLCTGRTAHRGSRGIALLFHDHGTRRG